MLDGILEKKKKDQLNPRRNANQSKKGQNSHLRAVVEKLGAVSALK